MITTLVYTSGQDCQTDAPLRLSTTEGAGCGHPEGNPRGRPDPVRAGRIRGNLDAVDCGGGGCCAQDRVRRIRDEGEPPTALWNARLGEDEETVPVFERAWYRGLVEEPDPGCKLRILATQAREVKTRSGDLLEVIRNAAAADAEIAVLWREIQAKLLDVQRSIVEQLVESKALTSVLDVGTATDILWTLNHPSVWRLLVRERGWTAERYELWLGDAFCAQLLRSGADT